MGLVTHGPLLSLGDFAPENLAYFSACNDCGNDTDCHAQEEGPRKCPKCGGEDLQEVEEFV